MGVRRRCSAGHLRGTYRHETDLILFKIFRLSLWLWAGMSLMQHPADIDADRLTVRNQFRLRRWLGRWVMRYDRRIATMATTKSAMRATAMSNPGIPSDAVVGVVAVSLVSRCGVAVALLVGAGGGCVRGRRLLGRCRRIRCGGCRRFRRLFDESPPPIGRASRQPAIWTKLSHPPAVARYRRRHTSRTYEPRRLGLPKGQNWNVLSGAIQFWRGPSDGTRERPDIKYMAVRPARRIRFDPPHAVSTGCRGRAASSL